MQISNTAVVFMCIAGAGAAILIAWALTTTYRGSRDGDNDVQADHERNQAAYMRGVPMRNHSK